MEKLVCQFPEQIPRWVGVMPRGQLWNVPSRPIALVRAVSSNHFTIGSNHFWSTLIVSIQCRGADIVLAERLRTYRIPTCSNDSWMDRRSPWFPERIYYIFTLEITRKEWEVLSFAWRARQPNGKTADHVVWVIGEGLDPEPDLPQQLHYFHEISHQLPTIDEPIFFQSLKLSSFELNQYLDGWG